MRDSVNIEKELSLERKRIHRREDELLEEAKRLLIAGQFSDKHILNNLKLYRESFELVNEEEVEAESVFHLKEIKNICIRYRLKFLDSQQYRLDIPYEAIARIKEINRQQRKDIKHFKVLASQEVLNEEKYGEQTLLFARTVSGNYHLVYQWGKGLERFRSLRYFPFRNFESLALCIFLLTLVMTLLMPTRLITTDVKAVYFSFYRAACFFHILIFNTAFIVYFFFAFRRDFSASNWDMVKSSR